MGPNAILSATTAVWFRLLLFLQVEVAVSPFISSFFAGTMLDFGGFELARAPWLRGLRDLDLQK